MSSHHIVRDEQEPALLLLAPAACPYEVIGQLLEWSPIVLTTEEALEEVLQMQIKVDVVFYSSQSRHVLEEKLLDQYPVTLIQQMSNNFNKELVQYLSTRKQVALNIVATAEMLDSFKQAFSPNVAVVIFTGQSRSFKVSNGKFEKWAAAGQSFQVDGTATAIHTGNLTAHHARENCYLVQYDGFVTIEADQPFWISEDVL